MQAEVLTMTNDLNHDEWLDIRKKGIGGSDAAAIAGLNKWKSPVAVYMEKIGEIQGDRIDSEAAYFGNVLEDVVAQEFSRRTGLKVRRRNAMLQHPEHPWMIANIDRLIVGEKTGLECKTTSAFLADQWDGEEVPIQYILQCQHYMAVTGFKAWWIAVLIGGNKFVYKKIERDDELISNLIDIEKDFWENHVVPQIPPDFDGSEASSELLKAMYPEAEPESEIELPDEAYTLIYALDEIKTEMDELSTRKKEYENKLKSMLGNFETGIARDRIVTWKPYSRKTVDSKRLKKERPEIYEQYLKESHSRRFNIK